MDESAEEVFDEETIDEVTDDVVDVLDEVPAANTTEAKKPLEPKSSVFGWCVRWTSR